ncbi:MAG: diphosphomevalonate decarboxylase [Pseudomonadota bacterium]|jgi:diphosphomevalonate decarboxylase
MTQTATATAHANIALAKYWGKADTTENLPAVPSLSLTLDGLRTETTVRFDSARATDELWLDEQLASGRPLERAVALLDRVRQQAGISLRAEVRSRNFFPTAAGLASSASGFAALAIAARAAAGLPFDAQAASALARRSSASAARSVYGGFAALELGALHAERVASGEQFPLSLVVAVTELGPKSIGSTEAMEHTRKTSPYYDAWLSAAPTLHSQMRTAVLSQDFEKLGPLLEQSCLLMHASMLGAAPAVSYWRPASLEAMQTVRQLRGAGVPAFFTMDAGPHVKVITLPTHTETVELALKATPGVTRVIRCAPGPDASVQCT